MLLWFGLGKAKRPLVGRSEAGQVEDVSPVFFLWNNHNGNGEECEQVEDNQPLEISVTGQKNNSTDGFREGLRCDTGSVTTFLKDDVEFVCVSCDLKREFIVVEFHHVTNQSTEVELVPFPCSVTLCRYKPIRIGIPAAVSVLGVDVATLLLSCQVASPASQRWLANTE